jgi:hypothetical protein
MKNNRINIINENLPVRIVWNACSTLVESKADVSIKDTPFFSTIIHKKKKKNNFHFTSKGFCFITWYRT